MRAWRDSRNPQADLDHPSALRPVRSHDRAAVLGHDLLRDRQSQARAALAAGEERLEQVGQVLGGKAGAAIGDRAEDEAVAVVAGVDGHRLAEGGELDGVLDHVLQDLQHAVGVDLDGREGGGGLLAELDLALASAREDRKSTRLNSSHGYSSYA